MYKIYENKEAARDASNEFHEKMADLEENFGAEFWENDDCAGSGYSFRYYDIDGKVRKYDE